MSYQRLMWHSGLTYRGVCPACRRYVVYTDYNLGFRAWFPDGFVYCPGCRKPIRHNENNAIKPDGTPYFPFPIRTPPPPGYVAYPIETLALNPQYVPQQNRNPQQTYYVQQPYVQQPNVQPPYPQPNAQQPNMQPPYPQQPNVQQPDVQPPNTQQLYPQQQYAQQPNAAPPVVQPAEAVPADVEPAVVQFADVPPVEVQQTDVPPVESQQTDAPPAVGRICPHCGKESIYSDALFCVFCGTKFDP